MRRVNYLLATLFGFVSHQAAAAVDCNADNITIHNAADASKIRKACPTISGDLVLSTSIYNSDSINLDGIESILGSIVHNGCEPGYDDCAEVLSLFNISSSTLTTVNGSVKIDYCLGLENLLFPNLIFVNQSISLWGSYNLTRLDLSELAYIGDFTLEAPVLERLDLNRTQGVTVNSGVYIKSAGSIDSVEPLFKNPSQTEHPIEVSVRVSNSPNIQNVTIGWSNLSSVLVNGENLVLTLGGLSTKSMSIGSLDLQGGFRRNKELQNLTVARVSIEQMQPLEKLALPFDDVVRIEVQDYSRSGNMTTIELPAEAEHWSLVYLYLFTPSVHFREFDDDGSKIWYWPKEIDILSLEGSIQNSFFNSFFKRNTTVTRIFRVNDVSGLFNCSAFAERLGSNKPGAFSCDSESVPSVGSTIQLWSFQLQLGVAVVAILILTACNF